VAFVLVEKNLKLQTTGRATAMVKIKKQLAFSRSIMTPSGVPPL